MQKLLLLLAFALTPWGTEPCPSVEVAPGVSWVSFKDDSTQIALMQNGKQLGVYHTDLKQFHPLKADGTFSSGNHPLPHPLPPQCQPVRTPDRIQNFGLDRSHIKDKERYMVNGHDVSGPEALKALTEKTLPNDKDYLRLTIIGPEELRKQVRHDLESSPELSEFNKRYLVQDYAPDNWAVKDAFVITGQPSIYLQSPDGRVLHRQDDYRDGPAGLAMALRRADPNYSPAGDRDARKANAFPLLSQYVPFAVFAIVALVLLLLPNKPKT